MRWCGVSQNWIFSSSSSLYSCSPSFHFHLVGGDDGDMVEGGELKEEVGMKRWWKR